MGLLELHAALTVAAGQNMLVNGFKAIEGLRKRIRTELAGELL